jgi:protein-S-isoprenylcysteine O-methyltransferase Ste14
MLLLQRQQINGNILGKGQKSKNEKIFETVLQLVTFLGVPVQFVSVIWYKLVWSLPVFPVMHGTGLILMLFSVVVFLLAVITIRSNWRAGYSYEQDTQLITNGVYRFSRNPAFVGFDLMYIGCALVFPNLVNVLFAFVVICLFHFQILGEERFLAYKFGKAYLDYKRKVRRYV